MKLAITHPSLPVLAAAKIVARLSFAQRSRHTVAMTLPSAVPNYVHDLIALYGAKNDSLLGTAVFYEQVEPDTDLEQTALRYYQQFVGSSWEHPEHHHWMDGWELLYERPAHQPGDIVNEFKAVNDVFESLLELLLNPLNNEDYETAEKKLAIAYNAAEVTDCRIYRIADEDILEGRLILGYRTNGEMTILVLLYD